MKNQKKWAKNPRIRSDGYAKDIVYSLEIDRIRANSAQPRQDFDVESIIKLADSIRRYGILQPLSVRRVSKDPPAPSHRKKNLVADILSASFGAADEAKRENEAELAPAGLYVSRETVVEQAHQLVVPDALPLLGSQFEEERDKCADLCAPDYAPVPILERSAVHAGDSVFLPNDTCQYELIAGERRLRAAKMLGMRHVPCIIVEVNDAISAELALVENMLRENLNMFEQAAAFAHLAEKYNLTQEEIAAKMSLSQSAVANKIRLLKLSEHDRQAILDADLTERHARALLRIPDDVLRSECLQTIIDRKLNVGETDKYITSLLTQTPEPPRPQDLPRPSPEKLCTNIYKFINRMQVASGNYLIVNRRSDDKNVVITLTVRR